MYSVALAGAINLFAFLQKTFDMSIKINFDT